MLDEKPAGRHGSIQGKGLESDIAGTYILLYVYARCVGLCLERWVIYAKIPSGDRERCIGSLGIRRTWVVLPTEVEARALVFVVYESSWTLLHPQ